MDVDKLRNILNNGSIEWRKHCLQVMAERNISQSQVIKILLEGEQIGDYPEDKPYPSALFLGWLENKPLHVIVALDIFYNLAYIITTYEPDLSHFEANFKKRRKRL